MDSGSSGSTIYVVTLPHENLSVQPRIRLCLKIRPFSVLLSVAGNHFARKLVASGEDLRTTGFSHKDEQLN